MSAVKLSALAFAGAAIAIPYHGNNHAHFHHNKRHEPAPYGASSGEAPFPIANGTQPAYGPTGSLVTYTSTSTNYKTVTSTVEFGSAASAGYGTGASVGAAGYSTGCTEDITVTTKIYETVTVTPGSSSSVVAPVETSASSDAITTSSSLTTSSTTSSSATSTSSSTEISVASAPSISLTYSEVAKGHSYGPAPTSSEDASSSSTSSSTTSEYVAPTSSSLSSYVAPTTTSSSAASTSSTSSGKGKRGVAYNDATLTDCLKSDLTTWGYNWNNASWGLDTDKFDFIPTLHDATPGFADGWSKAANDAIAAGAKTLFSFNEPDIPTQANLSPEVAAAGHIKYMKEFKGKAQICAPSISSGSSPDVAMGVDWLYEFFNICKGNDDCAIDCINLHYYGGDDHTIFLNYINKVHHNSTFASLPIYVTEIGVTGDVDGFLQKAMPWLDHSDFIQGYSYFMVSNGLLIDGTEPSSYGTTYSTWTNDTAVDYSDLVSYSS